MAYSILKSDGSLLINLPDQTADTSVSSLTLIGRGLRFFGKAEAENLIHLLENFASATAPAHPLIGQFWYDKNNAKMKVWNGTVWLRSHLGLDDGNVIPGVTVGSGLNLSGGTLTALVRSVAGRTGDVSLGVGDVAGAAPLLSPSLSGSPTAPTPATGNTSTAIATTAYVRSQILADTLNYSAGDGLVVAGPNLAVVGSTNRITVSPAGVDIAATYAGQASITTLGTIASGQWNATPIAIAKGGHGGTTASEARANLNALQFNAVADSLKSVGNGLVVNNSGVAVARSIVSGTPDKLSVTNGAGVAGDITISLLGGDTGPVPISGGGTGAITKLAAMNALSPATTTGDLIFYGTGGHERLAGRSDAGKNFFLTSGSGDAKPRWTTDLDAATLQGHDTAWLTNRANHNGTIDANLLSGKDKAFYLDYANFTGTFPSSAVVTNGSTLSSLQLNDSGFVRFNGGLTFQWGRLNGYYIAETNYPVTFPVSFTTPFSVTANVISVSNKYQDWFCQILSNSLSPTGFSINNSHASGFDGVAHNGWFWFAVGYIA